MATITISNITCVRSLHGDPRMETGLEGTSKTFLAGAPLVWSSGYLQEAGSDPTLIAGIAAEPGHNITAGTQKVMYYPLQGNVFEGNLAQAAANTTSATTDPGKAYGIVARSSGTAHWVVDSADTSATRVRILDFALPSIVGDVNARVTFTFFVGDDAMVVAG